MRCGSVFDLTSTSTFGDNDRGPISSSATSRSPFTALSLRALEVAAQILQEASISEREHSPRPRGSGYVINLPYHVQLQASILRHRLAKL